MAYIILGIGVGCWMYAFVNQRWNVYQWISSTPFYWIGLAAIIAGAILIIGRY